MALSNANQPKDKVSPPKPGKAVKPNLGTFPNIPGSPPPAAAGSHSDLQGPSEASPRDPKMQEGGGYRNQYKAAEDDDRGIPEMEDSLGYTRNASDKPVGPYKGKYADDISRTGP